MIFNKKLFLYPCIALISLLLSSCLYEVPAINTLPNEEGTSTHSLVYHFPCSEGSGTAVSDIISHTTLNAVGSKIDWCRGNVKGLTGRSFIKSGLDTNQSGVLSGNVIKATIKEYTVTFLTRITEYSSGPILSFSNYVNLRFYNNSWEFDGGARASESDVKLNTWVRVTFVQTETDQYIYINSTLSGHAVKNTSISKGTIVVGAFDITSSTFLYPGEYADIRIYDYALSNMEIGNLCTSDGSASDFTVYADGTDFAGFWKREMHITDNSGHRFDSFITTENVNGDMLFQHWFNGGMPNCDTSFGPISALIPSGNNSLWFSVDIIYPENLSANHTTPGSDYIDTVALYNDFDRNENQRIAEIYLLHTPEGSEGKIYLREILCRTLISQLGKTRYEAPETLITLDGREITKGVKHRFEIEYVQGESGRIGFYLDGEKLYEVTGKVEIPVVQVMFANNFGIHPQRNPEHPEILTNLIFTDNLYAGPLRITDYLNSK